MGTTFSPRENLLQSDAPWQKCWNDIFAFTERNDDYRKLKVKCRNGYRALDTKGLSMQGCVEYAIENGNHALFARYFLGAKTKNQLCGEMLKTHIKNYINKRNEGEVEKKKKIVSGYISIFEQRIIKDEYWRDYRWEYDKMSKEQFYSNSMIESWCYKSLIPSREAMIQIGLCLGLDSQEVNCLLQAGGHRALYPLDVSDLIGWYGLDYFKDKETISGEDKIKKVKTELNKCMEKTYERSDSGLVEHEKTYKGYNTNETFKVMLLGQKEPLLKDINEKIGGYRNELMKAPESDQDMLLSDDKRTVLEERTDSSYLTQFLESVVTENKAADNKFEEGLHRVIDKMMENEKLHGMFSPQRKYGYAKKTKNYFETPEKYYKNLCAPSLNLTKDNPLKMSDIEDNRDRQNRWRGQLGKSMKAYKNAIHAIRGKTNIIENDMEMNWNTIEDSANEDRYVTNPDGRRIGSKENGGTGYLYISNKQEVMERAIAAGREEEIGSYLKIAGYWECDLCAKDYNDISIDTYDRTDLLIIYAHKYKEALLDEWSKNVENIDAESYKAEAVEQFSFIALLMTINRDIQIALGIEGNRNKESIWKNELVFPVRASNRAWARDASVEQTA